MDGYLSVFVEWTTLSNPTPSDIALWTCLVSFHARLGKPEWFSVPGRKLEAMMGMTRNGVAQVRGRLVQQGVLKYRNGVGSAPGSYSLLAFVHTGVGATVGASEFVHTGVGATVGASEPFRVSSSEVKDLKDHEEDHDHDWTRERSYSIEPISAEFKELFGSDLTPGQLKTIRAEMGKGATVDLVLWSLRQASMRGAPPVYALKTLSNTVEAGILTRAQAEDASKARKTPEVDKPGESKRDERYEAFYELFPEEGRK